MRRMCLSLVLLQLLGCCLSTFSAGLIVVENWHPPILPPRPWPPPWHPPWHPRPEPYVFAPLEVSSLNVKTRIEDQVAVTTLEQAFYNPNSTRLEGTFMCPLPKGAQIDKFTLEIDERPCEAELVKADKARKVYEDIVRSLKDPALLEYAGQDVIKVRIFPIEPRSTRRITLKYTELLKNDGGLVSYALPLGVEKFSSRPVSNLTVRVELETRQSLKTVYSPSHAIEVKRQDAHHATAMLESTGTAAPSDFVLYFAPDKDEIGLNLLTSRQPGEDGYFLLLASPGVDVKENEIGAKDVALVLDTSGSMAGKKLEQAKRALEFCVENLNEKDRFQIIRFSTEVEGFFEGLVPASRENRDKAQRFVRDLRPMGGTAIDEALKKALALRSEDRTDRPFFVVFLTDGRPTVGPTAEEEIVSGVKKLNESRHRVFCFGIGTDVNTRLLDKITEETRAFSQYVLPEEDLELKVSSFYSKIKEPVLANPRLKVSGDPRVSKLYPSELPDLFKGQQAVVVGRYSGNGDAAITIEGTVNGATHKFTYEAIFPEKSDAHEFLPRLWATRRVGYLLDEIRLRGDSSELRDEVTELARRYGIVTPYTSYLIVEDEARRSVPEQARSMRDLQSDSSARSAGKQLWGNLSTTMDGLGAASAARESQVYKQAHSPAAATASGALEYRRGLGLSAGGAGFYNGVASTPEMESKARLDRYSQQAKFIGGKTFFFNDGRWVDAAIQKHPQARHVEVKFGSEEYFELSRRGPSVLSWLALGNRLRFVLNDVVYEITE